MIRLSIVEDRTDIRQSLCRALERQPGINCISNYASAEAALKGLPKDQPSLVLMDIGLPKMTGTECMIQLQQLGLQADFLMFTVFESDAHLFTALEAGAVGYVLKREGSSGVIRAIQEYQLGGAPMSRTIARRVLRSFGNSAPLTDAQELLTPQQYRVLQLLAKGLLNKEIGMRLQISERTVKQHNVAIYRKLKVQNRAEAVRYYLTNE